MNRTRPCRRRLIATAVLLPPVLWAAVLTAVPTDCARKAIAERLSRASGREVTIGTIRAGVFGGVYLNDLAIGAHGSGKDPWLRVDEASINVSLLRLLLGKVEPTEVDVRGLRLRVLRRGDGRLELADLLRPAAEARTGDPLDHEACDAAGVSVRVRDATVLVVDAPSGTSLEFTGVDARGTWQGRLARLIELRGRLNGGDVQLAAQIDCSGLRPRFEGQVKLRGVGLDRGMLALRYVMPLIAGPPADLDGRLALDLFLRGDGETAEALRRSVVGHGRVDFDPVVLSGSQVLNDLGRNVGLPAGGFVGAVRSGLTIGKGRIATDDLTIEVGRAPVVLAGWTDFDGRLSYRLRTDGVSEKLPGKARELLADLAIDLNDLADVRVEGTIDAPTVRIEGVPIESAGRSNTQDRRTDDRRRLQEIGRRLQDRIRR